MNDWCAYVRNRLPPLALSPARIDALVDELAGQLEQAYEDALAAGAGEDEACRRAQAQIVDWPTLARDLAAALPPASRLEPPEAVPPTDHAAAWWSGWLRDARYALRGLRRAPGFALVAVLTLALGIGANTAIFALVDAVVLRPLPYPQSGRLMMLLETSPRFPQMSVSYPDYLDWRKDNRSFTQMVGVRGADMILSGLGPAQFVLGRRVSANYFDLLQVRPALGRTFLPGEDRAGAPDVVVVSASFYHDYLGGDPSWLGRAIVLDGRPRTVIGVMPAAFSGLSPAAAAPQFWVPLGTGLAEDIASLMRRGNHAGLFVLGRLRPGVDETQARANIAGIASSLARQYPQTNAGVTVRLTPYLEMVVGDARPALLLLLAAVGLVLLIACANVANLVLARAATRQREQAVRAALGAGRARRLRQYITEGVCLGVLGGSVGLLLAAALLRLAPTFAPATLPRADQMSLDFRVFGFALAAALVTGALCGLAPAWQVREARLAEILMAGHVRPGGRRLRELLVGCEMALALLLLLGAGLLLRSLWHLQRADIGFAPRGVLSFIVGLPQTNYPTPASQLAFFRQAEARLERLPGVAAAGGVFPVPLGADNWQEAFLVVGEPPPAPGHEPSTDVATVRGHYFAAMGMRLLRGRVFTEADGENAVPVAIVDATLARRFFTGPDPMSAALGRQINLDGVVRTIVGVVANVDSRNLGEPAVAQIYLPQDQSASNTAALYFVLRAAGAGSDDAAAALRSAAVAQIQQMDAGQPVTDAALMDDRVASLLAQRRRLLALMFAFALLALALAGLGIYGVISYTVAERTHEIGIRMALGADRGRLMRMVLGDGLRLAGAGALLGVALSLPLGHLLGAYLYGVGPSDPLTIVAVLSLLLGLAAAACYLPARRAMRVDPLRALRTE